MKRQHASFSEDASAILDFARCQRADGSYYGTGGQCRLGKEVGPREMKMLKKAAAAGNEKAKAALAVLSGEKNKEQAVKELSSVANPTEAKPAKSTNKPANFERGGTVEGGRIGKMGVNSSMYKIFKAKLTELEKEQAPEKEMEGLRSLVKSGENTQKLIDGLVTNAPKGTKITFTKEDNLVTEFTTPGGNKVTTIFGRGGFNFEVNGTYNAGTVSQGRSEEMAIARQVQRIFNAHVESLPDNYVIRTTAHTGDGRGASRQKAYERIGFSRAEPGQVIYARKNGNSMVSSNEEEFRNRDTLEFAEMNADSKVPNNEAQGALWRIAIFGSTERSDK